MRGDFRVRIRMRFGPVFFCFVVAAIAFSGCKKKAPLTPLPEVQVITAQATNVPIVQEWIGTLDGLVNAQIRAQVTGYLLTRNYAEGGQVKKGDLLFEIDPRPFEAIVDQALGKTGQDQAQLAKAQLDVARNEPLAKNQAISQADLDNAVQAERAAEAQVKADEAAVVNARLNVGFTKVTSPIDGLAGIAQAQIGDLVGPNGPVLTTVSTINPMRVFFNVSERSYLGYWRKVMESTNDNELPLQLILADGSTYPEKGRFFMADRQVSPTTGTLQMAGLFPNPHFILRPGQYARVRAQVGMKRGVVVVPQRVVSEMQGSYQVTIIDDQNKAHALTVEVGEQQGSNWIIEKGLEPGQRIVIEGIEKAKDGALVNPRFYQARNMAADTAGTTNGTPPEKATR
jgi:membrane fusion protein (multidrug efflux system)